MVHLYHAILLPFAMRHISVCGQAVEFKHQMEVEIMVWPIDIRYILLKEEDALCEHLILLFEDYTIKYTCYA